MAARWMAPAVAAVATLLAGCARLPLAERPMSEERFADAYAQLLPVAALMGATAERDPQWPLGNKAALVSEAQLGCMRRALSPSEVGAAQRQLARDYAQAHPETWKADLQVLEAGAARLIGQAMREGAGLSPDGDARPATPEENRALAAFATDARYAPLRQATGLERLAGGPSAASGQRGKDIANVLTVKFLTDAFLRCHIPVKLLY